MIIIFPLVALLIFVVIHLNIQGKNIFCKNSQKCGIYKTIWKDCFKKLRFPYSSLPYGGFPGANTVRQ